MRLLQRTWLLIATVSVSTILSRDSNAQWRERLSKKPTEMSAAAGWRVSLGHPLDVRPAS
jgi:hypothetical protein